MTPSLRSLVAPCLFAIALAACGGGGDDDATETPDAAPEVVPDANTNPYTVEDAFRDVADTICAKAFECMSTYPGTDFETQFGASEQACVTMYEGLIGQVAGDYVASVDAGRIVFNSDDAQACIAAKEALACDVYWTAADDPACDTTFVGQVAEGGTCTIDDDCAVAADGCDGTTHQCTP